MKVSDLKAFLADKEDEAEVDVYTETNHKIFVKPLVVAEGTGNIVNSADKTIDVDVAKE